MNTETVLAAILPRVQTILKEVVEQVTGASTPPTLYDLEAYTQATLPRLGQILLQELTRAQGSGVEGPVRPCPCGQEQRYHDRGRRLSVETSVGAIQLHERACYHCGACGATSYPLDERLGLGQSGRMSRYLQEQCGWLLALLPARVAQQTLLRFGWPAVAASQIREHGEALGAELEQQVQQRLAQDRQEAIEVPARQTPVRQAPTGERLYAAPDGVMYCTTERDPQTGKVRWRELKVSAIYEAAATGEPEAGPEPAAGQAASTAQESVRIRVVR